MAEERDYQPANRGILLPTVSDEVSLTHPYIFMTWPGEQKPHCAPSNLANLSCIGWRPVLVLPRPSTVVMSRPSQVYSCRQHWNRHRQCVLTTGVQLQTTLKQTHDILTTGASRLQDKLFVLRVSNMYFVFLNTEASSLLKISPSARTPYLVRWFLGMECTSGQIIAAPMRNLHFLTWTERDLRFIFFIFLKIILHTVNFNINVIVISYNLYILFLSLYINIFHIRFLPII